MLGLDGGDVVGHPAKHFLDGLDRLAVRPAPEVAAAEYGHAVFGERQGGCCRAFLGRGRMVSHYSISSVSLLACSSYQAGVYPIYGG
jgi:hypothetical protein